VLTRRPVPVSLVASSVPLLLTSSRMLSASVPVPSMSKIACAPGRRHVDAVIFDDAAGRRGVDGRVRDRGRVRDVRVGVDVVGAGGATAVAMLPLLVDCGLVMSAARAPNEVVVVVKPPPISRSLPSPPDSVSAPPEPPVSTCCPGCCR
jgi:hypothetical protein